MKPTLVVMAAGVGSRYGGLKQIDPVGPAGEIMLDYSVYDARRAGFGRVVFIIRRDIEQAFREAVGSHFEGRIPVEYVFQELTDLPPGFSAPPDRVKPWGTAHALFACRRLVREPFAVINADDFYGARSYERLARYLESLAPADTRYAMVGFKLVNTLSEHGSVTRGMCEMSPDGILRRIVERFTVEKTGAGARYQDEQDRWVPLRGDEIASMNMFGFTPTLFEFLAAKFPAFLKGSAGQPKAEFLIPAVADELIREGAASLRVIETPESWFGVTYKEDKPRVMAGIRRQIEAGVYPPRLWA